MGPKGARLEIVDVTGSVEMVTFMNIWESPYRHSFAVRFGDYGGVEVDNDHGVNVACAGRFVDYDQKLSRRERKSSAANPPFVVRQATVKQVVPSASSSSILEVEFYVPQHERGAISARRLSGGEHLRVIDHAGEFVAFNDQHLVVSPRYGVRDHYTYSEWFAILQGRLARTGGFLDEAGVESGKDL